MSRLAFHGDCYYVYAGGCTTYHFDIHGRPAPSAAARPGLGFVSRDAIANYVHDYGKGRFELDPAGIGASVMHRPHRKHMCSTTPPSVRTAAMTSVSTTSESSAVPAPRRGCG